MSVESMESLSIGANDKQQVTANTVSQCLAANDKQRGMFEAFSGLQHPKAVCPSLS